MDRVHSFLRSPLSWLDPDGPSALYGELEKKRSGHQDNENLRLVVHEHSGGIWACSRRTG